MSDTQSRRRIPLSTLISIIIILVFGVVILLLPPISLYDRLSSPGYQMIDVTGTTLQSDNGAKLEIPPASVGRTAWLQFDELSPETDPTVSPAVEAIPSGLVAESPFYQIQHRGEMPQVTHLTIPVPDDIETFDLYAWDGQKWRWYASDVNPDRQVAEVTFETLPHLVTLLQPDQLNPVISFSNLPPDRALTDVSPFVNELVLSGLTTDENGELVGELMGTETSLDQTFPLIRNWSPDQSAPMNLELILTDASVQQTHTQAIQALVREGYAGVVLDYRGVDVGLQQAFTDFLDELRQTLPNDASLIVQIDAPYQISASRWDTGGYDWPAIGQIVDGLRIPILPEVGAFDSDGSMEALLDWTVSQVERRKVQLVFRENATVWVNNQLQDVTDEEILAQLQPVSVSSTEIVLPGAPVNLDLRDLRVATDISIDETSSTYWFSYIDDANRHHTVFLSNAAGIIPTLKLATDYHLRGVAIQSLSASTNPKMWEIMDGLSTGTANAVGSVYGVTWQIEDEAGQLIAEEVVDLRQPAVAWTAPADGGKYQIAANIVSNQRDSEVYSIQTEIDVATPTSTPTAKPTSTSTPTPTSTATPSPTRTDVPTETPTPIVVEPEAPVQPEPQTSTQQQPAVDPIAAIAPVASSNLPFGYGIQADPRGDTPANIAHIQRLGFDWVKFQMAWKDVESEQGRFNWAGWDQLVDAYHGNGIQILMSIPKAPDWARPFGDDRSVEGPAEDPGQYARFVAQVADRYRGRVQAIEVWNEQNLWYEAGGAGRVNAPTYVQLLQLSYQSIKSVNPDMIVVSGAMTPAGNVGDLAVDDIEYLWQMYNSGLKGFFDGLGSHPSGYNCPANGDWRTVQDPNAFNFRGTFENRHHSWCFRGTMEGYREVMVANGDGDKAIVPTEFGWAVSGNPQQGYEYARDNTLEEQAQWIVEAYQIAKNWGWVGPMFLWNLDYGVTAPDTELANFGIINRPAYDALVNMPKQ